MTLGEKICALRKERGLTQADLGNELGVTYQAISKWERDDSLPDFDMISRLAKMFGVPISHFENADESDDDSPDNQDNVAADEEVNRVLGVCTVCGKYVKEDNVAAEEPKLVCTACQAEKEARARRDQLTQKALLQKESDELSARYVKRTVIASIVAGVIALVYFIVMLVNMSAWKEDFAMGVGAYVALSIAGLIALFTWIFQLFFDGAVRSVTLSGFFFIKLPGIIFSADLDGLIFLIVMKILFFIISAVVFVGAMVVTSIAAMVVSLVTFIPVVIKIARRNEELLGD